MLRNILAAIVGHVAMAAALFALFSFLWLTVGALARLRFLGGARRPGPRPTRTWPCRRAHLRASLCPVAHDAKGAAILIGLEPQTLLRYETGRVNIRHDEWGSHSFAAGRGPQPPEVADVWPLNPEGEIMLCVKLEDQ